ncbi:hypothetical protein [Persicirhabdus sediminis]|uniref:SLA1 homology domain-containing protein n=1 Tax=Persicirhabdus sediminis TaxID=454144 RepID=A0A8J7SI62_9BACT|nr:hypothetical protein [Persicirhabdus sediminis]MBK1790334.1 hypothetical protein [Persicirhabdus sediminis]
MRSKKTLNRITQVCLLIAAFACSASAREWRDVKAGTSMEAEYVRQQGNKVVLKRTSDGKLFAVEFSRLSLGDQAYVMGMGSSKPTASSSSSQKKTTAPAAKNQPSPDALAGMSKKVSNDHRYYRADFSSPWPTEAYASPRQTIQVIKEDSKNDFYVYRSPHFEFQCDAKLGSSAMSKLARIFEATYDYVNKMPLGMLKAHTRGGYFKVLLVESNHSFMQLGGRSGVGGFYDPEKDHVVVPIHNLGVRKLGGSYRVDHEKTNYILMHELTHQLTEPVYFAQGSRGWFSEGIAEYVAGTRYESGKFHLNTSHQKNLMRYITLGGRHANVGSQYDQHLVKEVHMPNLEWFMTMSYGQFSGQNARANYAFGLLLTNYFIHLDRGGTRESLNSFLKGLHEGKTGQTAIDELLLGRSFDQLEKEIAQAYRRSGLVVKFYEPQKLSTQFR